MATTTEDTRATWSRGRASSIQTQISLIPFESNKDTHSAARRKRSRTMSPPGTRGGLSGFSIERPLWNRTSEIKILTDKWRAYLLSPPANHLSLFSSSSSSSSSSSFPCAWPPPPEEPPDDKPPIVPNLPLPPPPLDVLLLSTLCQRDPRYLGDVKHTLTNRQFARLWVLGQDDSTMRVMLRWALHQGIFRRQLDYPFHCCRSTSLIVIREECAVVGGKRSAAGDASFICFVPSASPNK